MMTNTQHADDADLRVLVFGDEDSAEFRDAAAHVETCELCRARLQQFAGSHDDLAEAGTLLGSYPGDSPCATTGSLNEILAPPAHPELLGRLGRYDIERVIGSGGMGIVLKAFDGELNRPVAIKLLAKHLAHSGAARQRFARESRAAAAVVHEHVVSIHNVESDEETPFLVMQYVAGESLQARVDREGPLDAKEILRIGIQAAGGLAAAHEQGVIHRDVKPANILLENGISRALITDFGLARTVDDASLTHTGVIAGTPHYMSPEQANGGTSDQRTDLFSLGSVLYFMATGHPPFRAERAMGVLNRICHDTHRPVWEVNPDIPDELSRVINRLLAKNPSKRFRSAEEVRDSLTGVLARLQQRRSGSTSIVTRLVHRHTWKIGAACLAVMAVVALIAVAWNRDSGAAADFDLSDVQPHTNGEQPVAGSHLAPTLPEAQSPAEFARATLTESQRESLNIGNAEWSAAGVDVLQRLNLLETNGAYARFLNASTDGFSVQVRTIDAQLDNIENEWQVDSEVNQ